MNEVSEGQGGALIKYFQFSKKLVWLFLAASTFLLLYTYYRAEITWHGTQGEKYFKYYIISLTGVLFWSLVLWFKDEIRSNIVMATISFVAGIYLVEIILNFANVPPKNRFGKVPKVRIPCQHSTDSNNPPYGDLYNRY